MKCLVPGCRGKPVFKIPSNKCLREKWQNDFPFNITLIDNNLVGICVEHFKQDDIIYETNNSKDQFGKELYYTCVKTVRLKDEAVPAIFPKQTPLINLMRTRPIVKDSLLVNIKTVTHQDGEVTDNSAEPLLELKAEPHQDGEIVDDYSTVYIKREANLELDEEIVPSNHLTDTLSKDIEPLLELKAEPHQDGEIVDDYSAVYVKREAHLELNEEIVPSNHLTDTLSKDINLALIKAEDMLENPCSTTKESHLRCQYCDYIAIRVGELRKHIIANHSEAIPLASSHKIHKAVKQTKKRFYSSPRCDYETNLPSTCRLVTERSTQEGLPGFCDPVVKYTSTDTTRRGGSAHPLHVAPSSQPGVSNQSVTHHHWEQPFSIDFDSESFIYEVQLRPAIWDVTSNDYLQKERKTNAWEELVNIFIPNKEASYEEKRLYGQQLLRRWKSLRNSYLQELKIQKEVKSGPVTRKRPVYKFFEQLSFLEKANHTKETENSSVEDVEQDLFPSPSYPATKKLKGNHYIIDKSLVYHVEPSFTWEERERELEESDKMFLLSLLNPLKQLPAYSRFHVRRKLINVIDEELKKIAPKTTLMEMNSSQYPF